MGGGGHSGAGGTRRARPSAGSGRGGPGGRGGRSLRFMRLNVGPDLACPPKLRRRRGSAPSCYPQSWSHKRTQGAQRGRRYPARRTPRRLVIHVIFCGDTLEGAPTKVGPCPYRSVRNCDEVLALPLSTDAPRGITFARWILDGHPGCSLSVRSAHPPPARPLAMSFCGTMAAIDLDR
jgi:hypothetical protein